LYDIVDAGFAIIMVCGRGGPDQSAVVTNGFFGSGSSKTSQDRIGEG